MAANWSTASIRSPKRRTRAGTPHAATMAWQCFGSAVDCPVRRSTTRRLSVAIEIACSRERSTVRLLSFCSSAAMAGMAPAASSCARTAAGSAAGAAGCSRQCRPEPLPSPPAAHRRCSRWTDAPPAPRWMTCRSRLQQRARPARQRAAAGGRREGGSSGGRQQALCASPSSHQTASALQVAFEGPHLCWPDVGSGCKRGPAVQDGQAALLGVLADCCGAVRETLAGAAPGGPPKRPVSPARESGRSVDRRRRRPLTSRPPHPTSTCREAVSSREPKHTTEGAAAQHVAAQGV